MQDLSGDETRVADNVSDLKPVVRLLEEPEKHEASDSSAFTTPRESPRTSMIIDIASDSTILAQLDDQAERQEIVPVSMQAEMRMDEGGLLDIIADEGNALEITAEDTVKSLSLKGSDEQQTVFIAKSSIEGLTSNVEVVSGTEDASVLPMSDEIKPTDKLQTDVTVKQVPFGVVRRAIETVGKDEQLKFKDDAGDTSSFSSPTDSPTGSTIFKPKTEDITLTHSDKPIVPDGDRERVEIDVEDVHTDIKLAREDIDERPTTTMTVDTKNR